MKYGSSDFQPYQEIRFIPVASLEPNLRRHSAGGFSTPFFLTGVGGPPPMINISSIFGCFVIETGKVVCRGTTEVELLERPTLTGRKYVFARRLRVC